VAELIAQLTDDGRLFWARMLAAQASYLVPDDAPPTPGWSPYITHFRIGEGGWEDLGAGAVLRSIDPGLRYESGPFVGEQNLDAAIDSARLGFPRYAVDSRFVFEKAFIPADITMEAPSTIRCRCRLELPEANNDGFGNSPEFWEIGLFSDHPTIPGFKLMVAYATMPKEIKHALKIIENVVRVKL
jgi:hypothetical protein